MRRLLSVMLAQINALLFSAGLVAVYVGVSTWSVGAAKVVLGLVLMAISAWPYVAARNVNDRTR